MDGWRATLLAAVGLFVLYLVARLWPALPDGGGRPGGTEPRSPRTTRLEARLLRRARRLPLAAKRRLRQRIERMIEQEQERLPASEPSDPSSARPEGDG